MRTVQLTERVPAPDTGRVSVGLAAALGAAHVVLAVAALVPAPGVFLGAAVAVTALEVAAARWAPFPRWVAARVGVGGSWRGLVRALAVLVLLVRSDAPGGWFVVAAGGLVAVVALRAVGTVLAELVARQRQMPVVTRGLSLAPVRIPRAPHPLVTRYVDETFGCPDLLLVAGAAGALLAGAFPVLVVGAVLAVVVLAAAGGVLARAALEMRRVTQRRFLAAVNRALDKVAPEVALYFAGGPETLYQLEMWVETAERLDVSTIIIVRDRETFRRLGPTRLPVLCVPHGGVLMGLELPTLRVALYAAHAANNLHLLRRRNVRHVFIGHGDSDKSVTTNPFLKAYDEVWVSGPAARERFHLAGMALDDARIVEVGRPQLDELARPAREDTPEVLTVLYAPTWEGYGDEPHQTSLGPCGVTLVSLLLAEPDVRIIYRPHPLAGTRDPAVARAHREILDLLGSPVAAQPAAPAEAYTHARDDLEVAGLPATMSRAEQVAASEVWTSKQLAVTTTSTSVVYPEAESEPVPRRHVLAPDPHFHLYACFAAADVLLCDVSSLITDFLATGRPYGVTNPGGLPAPEFAARYPSSRGGYLVDPDGHGLAGLLAAGRGQSDPAASARATLRDRLLGPASPPAFERLRKALAAAAGTLVA